ncbi:peptide chain release factor N(5)-glutamine methyltransferase [Candidatus Saccharibacteria bacterium]|nr:peptide chain release factor N(5)-glutamine methyltransferase [Candidatus Saccharibacteria bacterium]
MTATSPTTIKQWLKTSYQELKQVGVDNYSLDCLILLEYVLKTNRARSLAHQDDELSETQLKELNRLLYRRVNREPIAYILESKEFYGREFAVDKNVLIPRPESESFIELLKKHGLTEGLLIDVGTGSGILGITSKLEAPKLKVTLSDISNVALEVAGKNAQILNADVTLKKQTLFNEYYDVVLANLPYVPKDMLVEKELGFEPKIALFVDGDGLDTYRGFCDKVAIFKPKYVLTESLKSQHHKLAILLEVCSYELIDSQGLVQLFKQV